MPPLLSSVSRTLLIASLLGLAVSACGRRGALEPPPDPAAVAAQKQREEQRRRQPAGARGGSSSQLNPQDNGGPQRGRASTALAPDVGAGATAIEGQTNPPGAASVAEDPDDDEEAVNVLPSPVPRPNTSRKRGYVIPKEPFILDPLL